MPVHIGFLRAVNVGKRQFRTADLRAVLDAARYAGVDTYIQTGNIRITSPLRSRRKVEAELEALFLADRGFEVPTIVFGPAEIHTVIEDAEELGAAHRPAYGQYVSFLKEEPTETDRAAAEGLSRDDEHLVVRGRAAHLLLDVPFHEARTSNAQVERLLGVATNRNLTVVRAIAERWC